MTFKTGNIAVLVHGSGARLFTVGDVPLVEQAGLKEDGYMVREMDDGPAWQPPHEVHSNHLVKVKDRDTAVALVALINYAHSSTSAQVSFLQNQRDQTVRSLIKAHRDREEDD